MTRTKMFAGLAVAGVVLLGGGSCDVAEDRKSAAGPKPDAYADTTDVTLWRNADGIPNVAIFCADGLRFAATLSQDGARQPSLVRVPEQDRRCAK
jgi:hypothetical protein